MNIELLHIYALTFANNYDYSYGRRSTTIAAIKEIVTFITTDAVSQCITCVRTAVVPVNYQTQRFVR